MNCPKCNSQVTIERTEFFESRICESCLDYCEILDLQQCCTKPHFEVRKYIISNGTIQVRNQCINCGFVDGRSLGGFSKEQRESMVEIDAEKRITRDNKISNLRRVSFENVRVLRERKIKNNSEDYRANYLQSPEWKEKRRLVLIRDKFICQSCRRNNATDAHHLTYEMIYNEPLFHLIAVCRNCHQAIEEVKKNGATNIKIVHHD